MAASPTARTLARLRRNGFIAGVVERWNSHAKLRQDLFGFVDLVAVRADLPGTLFIQATTRGHINDRLEKMRAIPALRTVLLAPGNRVQVWGWFKRKGKWNVVRRDVTIGDLA